MIICQDKYSRCFRPKIQKSCNSLIPIHFNVNICRIALLKNQFTLKKLDFEHGARVDIAYDTGHSRNRNIDTPYC